MGLPNENNGLKQPKMLHILMTLLIYGVDTERLHCPERCSCTQFLQNNIEDPSNLNVINGTNFTDSLLKQNFSVYRMFLNGIKLDEVKLNSEIFPFRGIANLTSSSLLSPSSTSSASSYPNTKKCSKSTKKVVKDIFVNSNHTTKPLNNSKEIRTKRTLKLNVTGTSNGKMEEEVGGDSPLFPVHQKKNENKLKKTEAVGRTSKTGEIFTYQITCSEVRDLKPLWLQYLPNSTTRLIIRRTYFQSFKLFQQILRESPVKFNWLTVFSVSDSVINQKSYKKISPKSEQPKNGENLERNPIENKEPFLPFALLQNPTLRSKTEIKEFQSKGKFKNVRVLNLVNNTITFLPKDTFYAFQSLEILNLSNNLIKFIENETFSPLSDLLQLDLHKNRLVSLHENMFRNLNKLLYLDVSQNFITNLPPSTFQYLTNLNILNLAHNPLSDKVESIILLGTGKRLQIVDVSKTGLKQIPGTLERSVRVLDLMGNHLLSIRCGDLDGYSLLSYLNLKGNKISYIEDDALGRLEFLKILQISENNLFQIPKSLPNNLEVLNLSYNNIQNITNFDFLNLFLLKELTVSYNQISSIEGNAFKNLLQLRLLDLSHNPILTLPNIYGLEKLTYLNLSHFTNIPGSGSVVAKYKQFPIQTTDNIKQLNLESSPLLTAIFLQDTETLESFVQLEKLDVRFSNLTTIRKDIFGLLPKLKILKVEGNPWHCGKEILMLSTWLKAHKKENTNEQEDEINTAHCSTPIHLYKTSLVALEEKYIDGLPSTEMNKSMTWNKQPGSEVQMNNLESAESKMGSRGGIESKNSTDFSETERNITEKTREVEKVNLKKYSKSVIKVKTLLNKKTKENLGGKSHFFKNSEEQPEGKASGKNSTFTRLPSTDKRNFMDSNSMVLENSRVGGQSDRQRKSEIVIGRNENSTNFQIPVKNSLNPLETTPMSLGTVKKAEAVTAKDSLENEYNSHLSFFILSSIGLIVMATLTFSSVYFSRTRRDQSYQRQNQDIEVCSISSIGNELW